MTVPNCCLARVALGRKKLRIMPQEWLNRWNKTAKLVRSHQRVRVRKRESRNKSWAMLWVWAGNRGWKLQGGCRHETSQFAQKHQCPGPCHPLVSLPFTPLGADLSHTIVHHTHGKPHLPHHYLLPRRSANPYLQAACTRWARTKPSYTKAVEETGKMLSLSWIQTQANTNCFEAMAINQSYL